MKIEFAPLLTGRSAFDGPSELMESAGPDVAWENRVKAVLEVRSATRLSRIVNRGAKSLGLTLKADSPYSDDVKPSDMYTGVFFHDQASDPNFAPLDVIAEEDGSAQWYFHPMEVTVEQLKVAHALGLLTGDPKKIYFRLDEPPPGQGNGLDFWRMVLEAWPYFSTLLATYGTFKSIQDAGDDFMALVTRMRNAWGVKGGTIERFDRLFQIPRTTSQIAVLLESQEQDVVTTMHFFGFEQSRDGYWRPHDRPERKELRDLVAVLDAVGHWHMDDEMRSEVLGRILGYPAGDRAKHVDSVIRQYHFETREL